MAKVKKQNKKFSRPIMENEITLPDTIEFKKPDEFKRLVLLLDLEERDKLLIRMRHSRNFYKKVLEEDYRATNPNSYRYADAKSKLKAININGKLFTELIRNE